MSIETLLPFARSVLSAEAHAISGVQLGPSFVGAAHLVAGAAAKGGALVVSGLGKSGLVGQKLSATFASTGTPSHFLHATEAVHGDLGRIRRGDVVLLLSFGGGTEEVVTLAELLRQDGIPIVAITRSAGSALGRLATECIELGEMKEACQHNLAPTASTAATMAVGDALALSVALIRDFKADDFRKFHPGGGLGRETMPIAEALRFRAPDNLPLVHESLTLREAYELARKVAEASGVRRAGALVVVDTQGALAGLFTDGDLRRLMTSAANPSLDVPIGSVMTRKPKHLTTAHKVRDAVHLMRELRIDEAPVVDEAGRPVGLIDVQDLVSLKVIEG